MATYSIGPLVVSFIPGEQSTTRMVAFDVGPLMASLILRKKQPRSLSTPAGPNERTCSFCGKSSSEAPVVAAPARGGICEGCTRLACAILGVELSGGGSSSSG